MTLTELLLFIGSRAEKDTHLMRPEIPVLNSGVIGVPSFLPLTLGVATPESVA